MPIIRKRLTPDELSDPKQRWNPTGEIFEVWVGSEWVEDSTIDPRTNSPQLPPRVTADTRCDAATSIRDKIESGISSLSTGVSFSVIGTDLFIFLTTVLVGVGLLWSFVIAAAQALVAIGITTVLAALTEAVYDEFENIVYCLLDEDGQFTESAFAELGVKLNADIGGDAGIVLNIVTQLLGRVGMNNAAASGTATGDCSAMDCEWFVEFDFTNGSPEGWTAYSDASFVYGGFIGAEWRGTKVPSILQLFMHAPLAGIHVTGVAKYVSLDAGSGLGSFVYFMDLTAYPPASGNWVAYHQGGIGDTTGAQWQSNASFDHVLEDGLGVYLGCDTNGTGYIHVYKIRLKGVSDPPQIGKRVSSLTP